MEVTISNVERHKITHPHFGTRFVCPTPEVIGFINDIFPKTKGLMGMLEAADAGGVMPYCAGDNTFYAGIRKPHEEKIRLLKLMDGDATIIATLLEEHEFKTLLGSFAHMYIKHMH